MAEYVDEFRGTDDLYYAEVLIDDNGTNTAGSGETPNHGYVTGTVKKLAPVAESPAAA